METWSAGLFFIVFVCQIFLISYYYPEKLLARMKYVCEHFPPERYPRLYPRDIYYYRSGQARLRWLSRFTIGVGFLILFAALYIDGGTFAHDGYISEMWPVIYGMFQFLPLMLLEFSEYNQFKLMREARRSTQRAATLQPRRLFDHISPGLLTVAFVLYVAVIIWDQVAHDFEFSMIALVTTTLSNAGFVAVGAWKLYGKKLNPHQSAEDRFRETSVVLNSFAYLSIVISLFFAVFVADDVYDMDFLDASLLSFYFQAITVVSLGATLRGLRLEDIDFEVYREDAKPAEAT